MRNPYEHIDKYKSIDLKSRVESADPHELINMLLQGARTHIAMAQGCMQRKQIREKGEHIGKAISIIEGLKSSLNHESSPQLAAKLQSLYNYIQELLLKANLKNNEQLLIESKTLLAEIHTAWLEIKPKDN